MLSVNNVTVNDFLVAFKYTCFRFYFGLQHCNGRMEMNSGVLLKVSFHYVGFALAWKTKV